jgi:hypothetical protein
VRIIGIKGITKTRVRREELRKCWSFHQAN